MLASTRATFAVTLLACFLPGVRAACDSYVYLSYMRRGLFPLNLISSVSPPRLPPLTTSGMMAATD